MNAADLKKYAHLYEQCDGLKAVERGHGGAYLLSGEDEDGLKALARLAAARVCGADDPFAEHADIIVYPKPSEQKKSGKAAAKDEKQKKYAISVDDIKELIDSLYLTPFELDAKVYVIENAESMSEICQNKLLKSLEEPPARVCFVLCACGRLLPTVESRCNRIELAPFDISLAESELSKYHKDRAAVALAARASRGNIGLAERMLADPSFSDSYAAAKKILALATGSRAFALTAAVYEKLSRERVDAVLGIMEYLLADIARLAAGVDTVFARSDISGISVGFTPLSAALAAEAVRDSRRHNAANCMPQAVMDTLILKIMQIKYEHRLGA